MREILLDKEELTAHTLEMLKMQEEELKQLEQQELDDLREL